MDSKVTQIIKLVDKHIKTIIIIVFHKFKNLVERLNILSRDIENIKAQVKLLLMKMTMSEIKITVNRINGRLDVAENNSELEETATETIQNKTQREKRWKEMKKTSVNCETTSSSQI